MASTGVGSRCAGRRRTFCGRVLGERGSLARCGEAVIAVNGAVDFGIRKFEPIFDGIEGDTVGEAVLGEEAGFLHPAMAAGVALVPELTQLVQIALHAAMNALLIQAEEVELARVIEEGLGFGERVADFTAIAAAAEGEDVGLDGGDAVETPCIPGYELRELLLDGRFGSEGGDDAVTEGVVSFAFFLGKDGHLAGEAVTQIIAAGARFAFGGLRAGGPLRIAAVGFELFFRDGSFGRGHAAIPFGGIGCGALRGSAGTAGAAGCRSWPQLSMEK